MCSRPFHHYKVVHPWVLTAFCSVVHTTYRADFYSQTIYNSRHFWSQFFRNFESVVSLQVCRWYILESTVPCLTMTVTSLLNGCTLSMSNRVVCLQLNLMDNFRLSGLLQFTMDLLDFPRDKAMMHITARPPCSSQWWAHITDIVYDLRTQNLSFVAPIPEQPGVTTMHFPEVSGGTVLCIICFEPGNFPISGLKLFPHYQFMAITLKVLWTSCSKSHPSLVPVLRTTFNWKTPLDDRKIYDIKLLSPNRFWMPTSLAEVAYCWFLKSVIFLILASF